MSYESKFLKTLHDIPLAHGRKFYKCVPIPYVCGRTTVKSVSFFFSFFAGGVWEGLEYGGYCPEDFLFC